MSTIIRYKGNTIATANNSTKTLLTNGKWLEDNIEITSQTPTTATVAVTDTVDSAGGTVREITTGTAASDDVTYTTVKYNNATIASFHSDTTKYLRTGRTFAESDFEVVSDEPDTMSYEVTDTLDVKGGAIRDIEVTSEANRFFNLNYPNGDFVATVSSIYNYTAYGRTGIKKLYLPNCMGIGDFSLNANKNLEYIYVPKCSNFGQSLFIGSSIESLVLPSFNTGYSSCFAGMTKLKYLDVGNSYTRITDGFFRPLIFSGDTSLDTIILRSPNVVSLNNSTNDFTNTPFAQGGSGGTIYVPSSLIDSYKAASNWSVYDSYGTITWLPIEGSEYENKYADGTTFEEYENIKLLLKDMKNIDWFFNYKLYPNGKVIVDNISSFPASSLYNRKGITSLINFTATTINPYLCTSCENLSMIVLCPKTDIIVNGSRHFLNCTSLAIADIRIGGLSSANSYFFAKCYSLKTLILRRTGGIVSLGTLSDFENTPFAQGGTGGTVYVPNALIEDYKTATNWSTLFGYGTVTFLPIEGSRYEHYYADGTPIEEE